jgi:hypothetical protein
MLILVLFGQKAPPRLGSNLPNNVPDLCVSEEILIVRVIVEESLKEKALPLQL